MANYLRRARQWYHMHLSFHPETWFRILLRSAARAEGPCGDVLVGTVVDVTLADADFGGLPVMLRACAKTSFSDGRLTKEVLATGWTADVTAGADAGRSSEASRFIAPVRARTRTRLVL